MTMNHDHSNYLVCDRANTQSVTVRKVVEFQQPNYCNALAIKNLQYRPVRGKNAEMFIFHHFNWMAKAFRR